jgi:hypothetical protein
MSVVGDIAMSGALVDGAAMSTGGCGLSGGHIDGGMLRTTGGSARR